MRFTIGAIAAASLLTAASCTGGDAEPGEEGANTAEAASTESDGVTPLLARVDGLRLADDSDGVSFGMPQDDAVAAMTALVGEEPEIGSNDECGAGPMEFAHYGALTLNFQTDTLVGWSLSSEPEAPIMTPSGLTIGSDRDAVEAAPQAVFEETSLGDEFTADGVDGLMSEDGSAVTDLWAGTNCIFR